MAAARKDVDPAFQEVGQKGGLEIWRIENFQPVSVPSASYGKFFTGDSYIILKTTALKNGALRHDIHYWLGKDTSQDEAGVAAIKTVELDAALGGRAVQYREVQGHETEKFLSYFKPCIIPQEGGVASGFKHVEAEEHAVRLFVCKGKRVVHVHEVPFARSSLNHDDIFVLDTKSKIFQFNGSSSSIQERAKALEVVQYIKDTYHDGKCEVAAIDDGKLMSDAESGEFWGFFGGFAPLPRKPSNSKKLDSLQTKLYRVEKGKASLMDVESLKRELLETDKCYLMDCGVELYVWMGRSTSLENRKNSSQAAEELLQDLGQSTSQIIRVIEGYETVEFRSKFDSWPRTGDANTIDEGRGKVVALLKRQGINVKGLLKSTPAKEEPQPYIDCTGNLQVWRVSNQDKIRLATADLSKFYTGDCYIFEYSYPGEDKEEILIGTWFGKRSMEDERNTAISLAGKMVESWKYVPSQACFYEGNEPNQFYAIFQSFILFKGGLSDGYKKRIAADGLADDTYTGNSAMAATSSEEMESLLQNFDLICEDATNAAREMQLLQSKYREQVTKCEAFEVTCTSLKSENERLTKLYTGFVSSLSDQIEYRSKYEALQEQMKRSSDEYLQKEKDGNVEIQQIEQGYREQIEKLETQIRSLTVQNTENQKLIDRLRSDLASQNSHINAVVNEMRTSHHILELKYHQEVQDLKDCLLLEQEEKNELNKKLQDLEKELLLSTMKVAEQQRDSYSNRTVEGLKEKIMKLRKENDILKRKCKAVED